MSPAIAHLACLGLVATDMVTRAVRIRRLVKGLGGHLSLGDALRLNLLGDAAAELTPFRVGGEPSRVGGLLQSRVAAETAVLAVGVELVLSYALVALLVVGTSWVMLPAWWSSIVPALERAARFAPLTAIVVAGVAACCVFGRRSRPTPERVSGPTPESVSRPMGVEPARIPGVRSSVAALFRLGWRDIAAVFALGGPNVAARLGILWMLVSTVPGAPAAATILIGSFVLLFGQALAPTPSGLGVVEMGMLGGAAGPLGPHAVSILVYWRAYTAILPILLAAIFAVPRFGAKPIIGAFRLRRRAPVRALDVMERTEAAFDSSRLLS